MDKRVLIGVGVILSIPIVLLGIWALQGESMGSDFDAALRSGAVKGVHRDLWNKQWSTDELATIDVLKVPGGIGKERAITRTVHSRGRIFVSQHLYEYQATVRDSATNIIHVFGYRRAEPRHWCWEQIHPDSMPIHLQRRLEQMEALKEEAAKQRQQ